MREDICRVVNMMARPDYTVIPKAAVFTGGGLFAGMLSEQMQIPAPGAFDSVVEPILLRRGRYVQGESPSRFGILQETLRDYDPQGKIAQHVSQLTPGKARVIYERIWDRSGAADLPPELRAVHFETYIRRPQTARIALQQSGGVLEAYVGIRDNLLAGGKKVPHQSGQGEPLLSAGRAAPAQGVKRSAGMFESAVGIIMKNEGKTLVRDDNGKGPSKYGILQSTLQEYDPQGAIAKRVEELNDAKAQQIYAMIWKRSGSDKLPYPLNIIHFDTYLHRPKTAQESMNASDGDPMKYLETRQTSLRGLKSYSKYGVGWERRIGGLAQLAGATASAGTAVRRKA